MNFDPNQLMKQVQQMQAEMAKAQDALAAERVEGTAGGGAVTASATGQGELVSVKLSPDVVDPADIEMLEDLIVAAVTDALRASRALQESRLGGVAGGMAGGLGGLGLPGM
ncbi:MAG TPA: YbaB/EbfC family nucleoid-associated protein [Gaiellales bacterium]